MNNKGKELVPTSEEAQSLESALPAIVDTNIVAIAEQAEKRLDALNKIRGVALKVTNPHDWVDENGRPYLQSSGAEKVARVFGISWRIFEPTEDDLGSGHYLITYTGEFALSGAIITAIGTRSSKDPFFKKYKYAGDQRVELPVSEIDKGDVKKAAYTNLLANGITRLLGIRNLAWDELMKYANIRQDQVASVTFKKAGKAQSPQTSRAPSTQVGRTPSSSEVGSAPSSQAGEYPPATEKKETKQSSPDDPATLAQAQAIHSILKTKGVEDELSKMQKVAELLGLPEPPTAVGKLTKGQAATVIAALQKEAEGGEV